MTNKELLHKVYKLIRPYRSKLVISIMAGLIVAALSGLQAYMVKPLLDKIFVEKNTFFLAVLPPALILLFLVKGGFYAINQYLMDRVGLIVIRDLRIKLFEHLHKQSLNFFHKTSTGEIISRILNDIQLLQNAFSTVVVSLVRDLFQVIFLLIVVIVMNWKLALLSFLFLPIATTAIVKFGRVFRRLSVLSQEETARVSTITHESVTGTMVVKAFAMEEYENQRFSKQVHALFQVMLKIARYFALQHPLMEVISGLGMALIIWFGGREVITGSTTPGAFFAFLTALVMVFQPIKKVSRVNSSVQLGLAAAERVFTILDLQPEIANKKGCIELPPFTHAIEFRQATFGYESNEPILHDINLTIHAGEILAIVGPSGSGKSTLASLIPRFYDLNQGQLLVDGHDVSKVSMASLRNQIAVVTQQTILFNDTIRNNISYGNPTKHEEEIIEAARSAHALNFIEALPQGMQTIIGESGVRLSGGERQRLSIARALLKDAPILVLDEATSALDTESEREVQKALDNLMKNRTTLVIAHRLSTIKNADRIIVIKDGEIVEQGSHPDLLSQQGLYHHLYTMQH